MIGRKSGSGTERCGREKKRDLRKRSAARGRMPSLQGGARHHLYGIELDVTEIGDGGRIVKEFAAPRKGIRKVLDCYGKNVPVLSVGRKMAAWRLKKKKN